MVSRFSGGLAQLVAAMRNRLSGTAVTESEKAFLEPLIPDIGDQPGIIVAKLEQIRQGALDETNNYRSLSGLPELTDASQIRNYSSRKPLYEKEDEGTVSMEQQPKVLTADDIRKKKNTVQSPSGKFNIQQ